MDKLENYIDEFRSNLDRYIDELKEKIIELEENNRDQELKIWKLEDTIAGYQAKIEEMKYG